MKPLKIIWSKQAVTSVKNIYDFYKEKSPQGAIHVKNEILNGPKKLFFAHQYQLDDINPKYRRIIVRDFKLLYKEVNDQIQVLDVICTLKSPEILRNK